MPTRYSIVQFCCSLSEYTHSRESGYFQNTRFDHDVFHGFTHKCTPAFRCDKLRGFKAVSSSICEQFNSFIQNVETSSKLMSQCHFSLYLQFFIKRLEYTKARNIFEEKEHCHLWRNVKNREKEDTSSF